ncbi:hypothetical protein L3X38_033784 [Prunus dulcis]|uniref:Uncharacterized protein n=1 Tax=Prunus dulcis TaxID=3755 RepID=A0AAD4YX46_PRUDU|nr:hypothetical protein L3X38_033784 [Prunus dulcis]
MGSGIQNGFDKCGPPRVDAVSEIIPRLVDCVVDLIDDIGALASQNIVEDRGLTQHVEVILGSGNSEEDMPNPCVEASNGFKDDTFLAFSIPIITLQGSWAILSLPVHAVDATNHSWKSSSFDFL